MLTNNYQNVKLHHRFDSVSIILGETNIFNIQPFGKLPNSMSLKLICKKKKIKFLFLLFQHGNM